MTITIVEIQNELNSAIQNLRDSFDGFDFKTKSGFTLGDIDQIEGFEKIAVVNETIIEFNDFQSKIHKSLFSEDGETKKADFDWDNVANYYDEVEREYRNYQEIKQQIQDNLTGDQDIETAELHSELDLKTALMNYFEGENLIYEVNNNGDALYLLNDTLKEKLKDYL